MRGRFCIGMGRLRGNGLRRDVGEGEIELCKDPLIFAKVIDLNFVET
jgi:hypothetical protein